MSLQNVRIVLVGTSHPGNIGAACRVMKNMGLHQLILVDPCCSVDDPQATAMAANGAQLLASARQLPTLAAAVGDCQFVAATSARSRTVRWRNLSPRQCASQTLDVARTHEPVALVFGREKSGLTNAELDLCHALVQIPTASEFSSLNLAAAVQVICYELQVATRACTTVEPGTGAPPDLCADPADDAVADSGNAGRSRISGRTDDDAPASAQQMEHLFGHLERVLHRTGFLRPGRPGLVMRRARALLRRADPSRREVRMLRGMLDATEKSIAPHSTDTDDDV